MIEIACKELEKFYGANKVLENITLEVQTGEKVGIIGSNGSGKTTVFKILSGLENYDGGLLTIRKGASIGYLKQIPYYEETVTVKDVLYSAFGPATKILDRMKELEQQMLCLSEKDSEKVIRIYGELQVQYEHNGGYEIDEKLNRVCNGLKMDEDFLKRSFHALSGGEKTRVLFGKILLESPDILLLDEPTNHLDMDSIEWLEAFLREYSGTVLLISHDRYFLDHTVNKIIEIEDGESNIFIGNYSYYVEEKDRRLLEQFEAYQDQQKKIKAMEEAIARFRDWGSRADNPKMFKKAANMERRIEKMNKIDRPILERRKIQLQFAKGNRSGKDVLQITDLKKTFGTNFLFEKLDITVQYGERVAILGKNGCGKSTFIKLILNQLQPDLGEIRLGSNVKIGYLEQDIVFEHPERTVLETFRENVGVSEGEARKILAKFLFYGQDVFRKVDNLSGGQKSRLKLCLLMMEDINLLILDEPTNHLDIDSREMMEEALDEFTGTVLFISHDRYFVNKITERIVEIENGTLVNYLGNYDYYRQKKQERKTVQDREIKEEKKPKEVRVKEIKSVKEEPDKQILKLEESIEKLQREIIEKDAEISKFESNYERLSLLCNEKQLLQVKLDELLEEWIKLN